MFYGDLKNGIKVFGIGIIFSVGRVVIVNAEIDKPFGMLSNVMLGLSSMFIILGIIYFIRILFPKACLPYNKKKAREKVNKILNSDLPKEEKALCLFTELENSKGSWQEELMEIIENYMEKNNLSIGGLLGFNN